MNDDCWWNRGSKLLMLLGSRVTCPSLTDPCLKHLGHLGSGLWSQPAQIPWLAPKHVGIKFHAGSQCILKSPQSLRTGARLAGQSSQEKPVTPVLPAVARGEQLAGTSFFSSSWQYRCGHLQAQEDWDRTPAANADTSERHKRPHLHTAICVQGQVFGRSRDTVNACTRLCTVCKITMSPAGTSGSHWDFTSSQNNAMASALTVVTQPLRTHLSRHTRAATGHQCSPNFPPVDLVATPRTLQSFS